jgi:hypothetical protein
MTNIEKFNRFLDERIKLASSVNTQSAYYSVKAEFNRLFKESPQPKEEACSICGRPDVKVYENGEHLCVDCLH